MKLSTISRSYPSFRDVQLKNCQQWLRGKQTDDNAEKLWRVHDKLYDLTEFIDRHPGGRDWIEMTQATDITELYETHHLNESVEIILDKYFVREAAKPRNYKLTFQPDGFYRTLKKRVSQKMITCINYRQLKATSKTYSDLVLASTLLFFVLVARDFNLLTAVLASASLFLLTVISHNFLHQRDNWRMYLINLSTYSYRDWRIFHVMSHHMYPNSFHDLECSFLEPHLNWMPVSKPNWWYYYVASPIAYLLHFPGTFVMRIGGALLYNHRLHWDELIPLSIPTLMYIFGKFSLIATFSLWYGIVLMTSFFYGFFANNAFHDGDELKSMDFGVYQLAATFERAELNKNRFVTLSTFGHHVSHHLFPTLDHSLLPELNEIIHDTCKEFETELKVFPWYELVLGQFRQLRRERPIKIE